MPKDNEEKISFLLYKREDLPLRPVQERIKDWKEIYRRLPEEKVRLQSERCMACGVPFCHYACPLGNHTPKINQFFREGKIKEAIDLLHQTNNFPEFTGLLCPALCEKSCVLGLDNESVTIRQIELSVVEKAWARGYIKPKKPCKENEKSIAIIGSGPAGLTAAQQLRRIGYDVTIFERTDKPGGFLRYGIPDFKLEKHILDRRISQMEEEGVIFKCGIEIGSDIKPDEILEKFDAVILACGSNKPRDLDIQGKNLKGIYYATDYLSYANQVVAGKIKESDALSAKNKNIIIIGGGDTGADCLSTAVRQGAKSVIQFELFPPPPETRPEEKPWPLYVRTLSHPISIEEGGIQFFRINTKRFIGNSKGEVIALEATRVVPVQEKGKLALVEVPNSVMEFPADMVILALGFTGPATKNIIDELRLELTKWGTVKTDDNGMTSIPGVFAAGDMVRGQSLIVWAIAEGRKIAHEVDKYIFGNSKLQNPLADYFTKIPFEL
ncbi:MAG: glutamate synthase subunit beta [Candidatus Marinimicrobia bacterium]|nr:glutamate synthase subunit beta [Candidatus Neomarinimicrobiota bacterium]